MRALALLLLLTACGGDDGGEQPEPSHTALGTCGFVDLVPLEAGIHVDEGTAVTWSTNPPTTGKHYRIWAAYDRAYGDLARGYWVHNLEHGAIVFSYHCPAGCADDIAALEAVVRAMAVDPTCAAPVRQRALIVADPLLPADVKFAAIGWGASYTASCLDPDSLAQFAAAHYRMAPEDLCAAGANFGGDFIAP